MHGRMEKSNIREMSLPRSAISSKSTANLRHWFPWIVSTLVFSGSWAGAWHIYQEAERGVIAWAPYPLFGLFVLLAFIAYSRIFRDGEN